MVFYHIPYRNMSQYWALVLRFWGLFSPGEFNPYHPGGTNQVLLHSMFTVNSDTDGSRSGLRATLKQTWISIPADHFSVSRGLPENRIPQNPMAYHFMKIAIIWA